MKHPMDEVERESDLHQKLETALGAPFSRGNRITVLRNGVEIFPAMLEAIDAARETIEFLTFVYWSGDIAVRFADALADRAADGLRVKVLLDAFGAAKIDNALVRKMRNAGAQVAWFRPLRRWRFWENTERTHRKLLICDGRIGFTGGVGIAAEWEGDARDPSQWRDTHFRVEGPAVAALRSAFVGNWAETRARDEFAASREMAPGEGTVEALVVRSVASQHWSDIATAMRPLLHAARSELRITSPYFVPDQTLREDLIEVVGRGVRVQVLTSGEHHDHDIVYWAGQRHYEVLMAAGVEVFEYDRTMLHAKIITVDGYWSCIGSANFNQRSFGKDDEVCLICADEPLAQRLNDDFEADCTHARCLELDAWRQRGWLQRAREQLTRLVDTNL